MTPIRPQLMKLKELGDALEHAEHQRQKVLTFMRESPLICFMKDAETGRYQFMSRNGCEVMGRKEEEIVGHTDNELFPEELALRMIGHDLKVMRTRQAVISIEARAYKEEEEPGLYLVSKFLVVNGAESIGGIALELPDTFKVESLERP